MNNYDTYCYQFDTQSNSGVDITPPQTDQVSWADCDAMIKQETQNRETYHMSNGDNVNNFFTEFDMNAENDKSTDGYFPSDLKPASSTGSIQSETGRPTDMGVSGKQLEVERKKALNRAAQRAFRERREQKVKELEDQLAVAQQAVEQTTAQNERMFHENTVLVTENKILREKRMLMEANHKSSPEVTGPGKVVFPDNSPNAVSIVTSKTGDSTPFTMTPDSSASDTVLLNRAGIWAKIVENPNIPDDIDFDRIVELLKGKAVCEEKGPVFLSEDVEKAIEEACKYLS